MDIILQINFVSQNINRFLKNLDIYTTPMSKIAREKECADYFSLIDKTQK